MSTAPGSQAGRPQGSPYDGVADAFDQPVLSAPWKLWSVKAAALARPAPAHHIAGDWAVQGTASWCHEALQCVWTRPNRATISRIVAVKRAASAAASACLWAAAESGSAPSWCWA